MKKLVCIVLAVAFVLSIFTACATNTEGTDVEVPNTDYETGKTIVLNYAKGILNAWRYGLNEKLIYDDESMDANSPERFDFDTLVNLTGFEKEKMKAKVMEERGYTDKRAINGYETKFYVEHNQGYKIVEKGDVLASLSNRNYELSVDQYKCIVRNMGMVKYFYEELYKSELDEILNRNSSEEFIKLKELKTYIDDVIVSSFDVEHYTDRFEFPYLFESNYRTVSSEVKNFCANNFDVMLSTAG